MAGHKANISMLSGVAKNTKIERNHIRTNILPSSGGGEEGGGAGNKILPEDFRN